MMVKCYNFNKFMQFVISIMKRLSFLLELLKYQVLKLN